jgi:hypothetical protein
MGDELLRLLPLGGELVVERLLLLLFCLQRLVLRLIRVRLLLLLLLEGFQPRGRRLQLDGEVLRRPGEVRVVLRDRAHELQPVAEIRERRRAEEDVDAARGPVLVGLPRARVEPRPYGVVLGLGLRLAILGLDELLLDRVELREGLGHLAGEDVRFLPQGVELAPLAVHLLLQRVELVASGLELLRRGLDARAAEGGRREHQDERREHTAGHR